MKIVNLTKGEPYQLSPDTQLSVERTNPFFNDYGEQTVPLDLPASEHNRRLLDFPETFGRREKMKPMEASIQDGEYYAQCRQYVLAATRKGTISTSFYLNDGSFYSRIQKIKLKDIFKDEFIPGVDTVEQGIRFCESLRDNKHPHYTNFPILVDDDSGKDTGFDYKIINAYGRTVETSVIPGKFKRDVSVFKPDDPYPGSDFYNAVKRVEYVNDIPITLAPGYYISPFIRANYVLQRVFAHFGYTLQDNFFTQKEPFKSMVLLNNVIDVLVNGKIKVADLVPDITCTDFLEVFRKKFCCEFTSDEGLRTANVIFLRDALAARPVADLTKCMTEEPTLSFKSEKDFKRIVISSKKTVNSQLEDSYDDIDDMVKANPTAYHDPVTGSFFKTGFSGINRVTTKIGEASQAYNTGEDTETTEINVPDCIPEFRTLHYVVKEDGNTYGKDMGAWLYVGKYNTLNSKMEVVGTDNKETEKSADTLLPMLAFSYLSESEFWEKPAGTISSYDLQKEGRPHIFGYALYYHGPDGIFERFYRDYDTLLRNALQELKIKLLLSRSQKQNLPAHGKVVVRGAPFFFNKLKFTLGGKNEPVESELRSISLSTPIVSAPTIMEHFPVMGAKYKWVAKNRITEVTENDYNNAGPDKDRVFQTIYPPAPSAEWVNKPYNLQTSIMNKGIKGIQVFGGLLYKYAKIEVWLECIPV